MARETEILADILEKRWGRSWEERVRRLRQLVTDYGGMAIFKLIGEKNLDNNIHLIEFLDRIAAALEGKAVSRPAEKFVAEPAWWSMVAEDGLTEASEGAQTAADTSEAPKATS